MAKPRKSDAGVIFLDPPPQGEGDREAVEGVSSADFASGDIRAAGEETPLSQLR
jgi:hypothetical protein